MGSGRGSLELGGSKSERRGPSEGGEMVMRMRRCVGGVLMVSLVRTTGCAAVVAGGGGWVYASDLGGEEREASRALFRPLLFSLSTTRFD